MKQSIFLKINILILLISLSSCQLITIGEKPNEVKPIIMSQLEPEGTIRLFIKELENNNVQAATQIIEKNSIDRIKAIERYEIYYEIERVGRIITNRSITLIKNDTLNTNKINYLIEFDYLSKFSVETVKMDSIWYITNYSIN